MSVKVKLKDITEGMEFQLEDTYILLNTNTGEIVSISSEHLRVAEDGDEFEHLPDWQQEKIEIGMDIIENEENYKQLPTQFEIHEYAIMEDFCYSVPDNHRRNDLFQSIQGKGAFRRFKDKIYDLGIEHQWYLFRNERLKEMAIEWCKENEVDYYE
jgi:hypothetical protein